MSTKLMTLVLLCISIVAWGQEEKKEAFNFEIVADTYFKTGINSTNSVKTTRNTPPTSFADKPGFALGMVNAIASYNTEKVTIVADLVEGPRGEAASDSPINQLYVKYRPISEVEITFGKFNTFLGYEVISPKDDFNYSTSYLFSNGPFSHTGIKARYHIDDKQSLLLGIMNANDDTKFNSYNSYTLGFQYNFYDQNINMIWGNRDDNPSTGATFEIDYTGGLDLSDRFFLGINTSYETTYDKDTDDNFGFYGIAFYALAQVRQNVKLGLRPEYFTKYAGENNSNTIATTLSANWSITENLMLIPELRLDYNEDEPFVDRKLKAQKGLSSFLVGVVYHFDKTW